MAPADRCDEDSWAALRICGCHLVVGREPGRGPIGATSRPALSTTRQSAQSADDALLCNTAARFITDRWKRPGARITCLTRPDEAGRKVDLCGVKLGFDRSSIAQITRTDAPEPRPTLSAEIKQRGSRLRLHVRLMNHDVASTHLQYVVYKVTCRTRLVVTQRSPACFLRADMDLGLGS